MPRTSNHERHHQYGIGSMAEPCCGLEFSVAYLLQVFCPTEQFTRDQLDFFHQRFLEVTA